MKPRIVIIFDGIICEKVEPFLLDTLIPTAPIPGSFEKIFELSKTHDIRIYSPHRNTPAGILSMQAWMEFYSVRVLPNDPPMFVANHFCNSVVRGRSTWPSSLPANMPILGTDAIREWSEVLPVEPFQKRVEEWIVELFGQPSLNSRLERGLRFAEEAIELAQSLGFSYPELQEILHEVYSRAPGNPVDEISDVLVTLAGLAGNLGVDMDEEREKKLEQNSSPKEKERIKRKNLTKRLRDQNVAE